MQSQGIKDEVKGKWGKEGLKQCEMMNYHAGNYFVINHRNIACFLAAVFVWHVELLQRSHKDKLHLRIVGSKKDFYLPSYLLCLVSFLVKTCLAGIVPPVIHYTFFYLFKVTWTPNPMSWRHDILPWTRSGRRKQTVQACSWSACLWGGGPFILRLSVWLVSGES